MSIVDTHRRFGRPSPDVRKAPVSARDAHELARSSVGISPEAAAIAMRRGGSMLTVVHGRMAPAVRRETSLVVRPRPPVITPVSSGFSSATSKRELRKRLRQERKAEAAELKQRTTEAKSGGFWARRRARKQEKATTAETRASAKRLKAESKKLRAEAKATRETSRIEREEFDARMRAAGFHKNWFGRWVKAKESRPVAGHVRRTRRGYSRVRPHYAVRIVNVQGQSQRTAVHRRRR
jgi:hypothetical protein